MIDRRLPPFTSSYATLTHFMPNTSFRTFPVFEMLTWRLSSLYSQAAKNTVNEHSGAKQQVISTLAEKLLLEKYSHK
jgi:hypothetical protein